MISAWGYRLEEAVIPTIGCIVHFPHMTVIDAAGLARGVFCFYNDNVSEQLFNGFWSRGVVEVSANCIACVLRPSGILL